MSTAQAKAGEPIRIKYKRPFVYDYQRSFMDGPERYTLVEGATKVGKSTPLIIWLFEQALSGQENQNFWWVAPVYNQAAIMFKRMQAYIKKRSGPDFFVVNKTDMTLTLPNGAVIWFKSADDPDNLFGEDVYAAVFDEASRAKEEGWFALRSTLTSTGGKCKFIANVRGRGWYYQLAQYAKNSLDPKYAYYKVNCWDAVCTGYLDVQDVIQAEEVLEYHGVYKRLFDYAISPKSLSCREPGKEPQRLPLDEILDAEKTLPAHVFKELFEAEPADDGTNPFGMENIEKARRKVASKLSPVCYGVDLASRTDFTVFTGLDRNKQVCYFKRFQLDWNLTRSLIKAIPDKPLEVDGTGVGAVIVDEMSLNRKHFESFIFSASAKQRLIEALVTAFQQGEIGIPYEGPLYDELKTFEFSYSKSGGVKYEAAGGGHDDCVMSLALAWDKFRDQPKPTPPPKSKLIVKRISKSF